MRCVLVTGASRGIGRAVAVAFAERGDRVAVHYSSKREDAEETLARLPGDGHALLAGDLGDLGDPQTVQRILDEAVEALGGVEVLVNNAAVAPSADNLDTVAEVSYPDWQRIWQRMIDVNLLSAVNLTYAVARHPIERSARGGIVNHRLARSLPRRARLPRVRRVQGCAARLRPGRHA